VSLVKHKASSKLPKAPKASEVQYIKIYPCGCKAGPGPENLPDYCPEHGTAPGTEPPVKGPDVIAPAEHQHDASSAGIVLPGVELVAAKIHDAWMEAKRAQGITSRPTEDGIEQMVPYDQLPEKVKDLDRAGVKAVYAAITESLLA
jgi:hypothetical protein